MKNFALQIGVIVLIVAAKIDNAAAIASSTQRRNEADNIFELDTADALSSSSTLSSTINNATQPPPMTTTTKPTQQSPPTLRPSSIATIDHLITTTNTQQLSSSPTISSQPTITPSYNPTNNPTYTHRPSTSPSITTVPSLLPTIHPSVVPTISTFPSYPPSVQPTYSPIIAPSIAPSTEGTFTSTRQYIQRLLVSVPQSFTDTEIAIFQFVYEEYTNNFGYGSVADGRLKGGIGTVCEVLSQQIGEVKDERSSIFQRVRRRGSRLLQSSSSESTSGIIENTVGYPLTIRFIITYSTRIGIYDISNYNELFTEYINSNLQKVLTDLTNLGLNVVNVEDVLMLKDTGDTSLFFGDPQNEISTATPPSTSPPTLSPSDRVTSLSTLSLELAISSDQQSLVGDVDVTNDSFITGLSLGIVGAFMVTAFMLYYYKKMDTNTTGGRGGGASGPLYLTPGSDMDALQSHHGNNSSSTINQSMYTIGNTRQPVRHQRQLSLQYQSSDMLEAQIDQQLTLSPVQKLALARTLSRSPVRRRDHHQTVHMSLSSSPIRQSLPQPNKRRATSPLMQPEDYLLSPSLAYKSPDEYGDDEGDEQDSMASVLCQKQQRLWKAADNEFGAADPSSNASIRKKRIEQKKQKRVMSPELPLTTDTQPQFGRSIMYISPTETEETTSIANYNNLLSLPSSNDELSYGLGFDSPGVSSQQHVRRTSSLATMPEGQQQQQSNHNLHFDTSLTFSEDEQHDILHEVIQYDPSIFDGSTDELEKYTNKDLETFRTLVEENVDGDGIGSMLSLAMARALTKTEVTLVDLPWAEYMEGEDEKSGSIIEACCLCETYDWLKRHESLDYVNEYFQDVINRIVLAVMFDMIPPIKGANLVHAVATILGLDLLKELPQTTLIVSGMRKTNNLTKGHSILLKAFKPFGKVEDAAVAPNNRGFGFVRYIESESVSRAQKRYRENEIELQDVSIAIKTIKRER